jgi:hypothetical protein
VVEWWYGLVVDVTKHVVVECLSVVVVCDQFRGNAAALAGELVCSAPTIVNDAPTAKSAYLPRPCPRGRLPI